ncbi:hypothetical protein F442_00130 [Phytophthora nicotianae P10297]|uniref:Uncharacterized protein n=6 Tax=Phytophthora nicotianae TaxID=4792 RepID=W2RE67_PHYN3|nr:hypothetical protein PPTG_20658 [Phytophthora nicotianae INRA-310]ETI57622.1 hypothetical protein F443_00139 [Phytophthora nicotianae P1569]ETN23531.1 hypothetical protein PPTG_20658 [Phytophthora nicotianae INRA-310]ETO86319.1 hypothetical protein F444_00135 [Phytophthora nicotianae P1976]ETP55348.1 hypothetical protein F442_00130 [Phytophthora nicotianae P10297]
MYFKTTGYVIPDKSGKKKAYAPELLAFVGRYVKTIFAFTLKSFGLSSLRDFGPVPQAVSNQVSCGF